MIKALNLTSSLFKRTLGNQNIGILYCFIQKIECTWWKLIEYLNFTKRVNLHIENQTYFVNSTFMVYLGQLTAMINISIYRFKKIYFRTWFNIPGVNQIAISYLSCLFLRTVSDGSTRLRLNRSLDCLLGLRHESIGLNEVIITSLRSLKSSSEIPWKS